MLCAALPPQCRVRRAFGYDGALRRLRELKAIWLSHRHADHHVGISHLLSIRAQQCGTDGALAPKIPLFGPFPLRKVLSACNKIEPLQFSWHDQYRLCPQAEVNARGNLDFFWEKAGSTDVQAAAQRVREVKPLLAACECISLHSWLAKRCKQCAYSLADMHRHMFRFR